MPNTHSTLTGLFTDIASAIREKDSSSAGIIADAFPSAIRAIPTGGGGTTPAQAKDVNFIDYDGTILHSYTAAEFATLTAMPANPDHSSNIKWAGETIALTSQGWNYTLAKAQEYVAKYGKLWIGQMYIPTDGKTYVCIHLEGGRTSPMLGICPNGTVDVDWGDGTAHDTLTGTSLTTVKWTPTHEYAAAGDYIIKLNVTSGTAQLYGSSTTNQPACLLRYASETDERNRGYLNSIQSMFVGSTMSIGDYAFGRCYSLASVTIPDGVTSIGNYAFNYCYSLASVTIPDGATSIGNYAFSYCYSLASVTIPDGVTSIGTYAFSTCCSLVSVTIPDGVTSIGNYAFNYCYSLASVTIPDGATSIGNYAFSYCLSLASVTIPDGVTSIGDYAFSYCYFLSAITFEPVTPPTVSASSAWSGIPADCIIYVPAASLDAYKTATNYPSPTTYTYIGY